MARIFNGSETLETRVGMVFNPGVLFSTGIEVVFTLALFTGSETAGATVGGGRYTCVKFLI